MNILKALNNGYNILKLSNIIGNNLYNKNSRKKYISNIISF